MKYFYSKRGFTLVEIVVSLAIFSVVSLVAVGSLLKIVDVNKRAQSLKTAVNNVNFTMESMVRDMRVGFDYRCDINFDYGKDCNDQGVIVFNTAYSGSAPSAAVAYRLSAGVIQRADFNPTTGSVTYIPVTATNVTITDFKVSVFNTNTGIPYAQIYMAGKAGTIEKTTSSFEIMTTVSQRLKL